MSEVLGTYASSSSNKVYQVIRGHDGVIYCTCPGWKFSRNCKHLQAYNSPSSAMPFLIKAVKKGSMENGEPQVQLLDEVTANVIAILKGVKK